MSETKNKTRAEMDNTYLENLERRGLTYVKVLVPLEDVDRIKNIARTARAEAAKEAEL